MPTSPPEDEPDDRFLRDPEDLTGFLQDIDPKAGDRFLPFEPEDGDADGRDGPALFWGAGKASDPSRGPGAGTASHPSGVGSAGSAGRTEPSEAGDDRIWEAMGGISTGTEAGAAEYAAGDGASEETTDRATEVPVRAEEAPDELEADPDRFWGRGFMPAAGEDRLTSKLTRLERLMWDAGDH